MRFLQASVSRMRFRGYVVGGLTLLVVALSLASCANPLGDASAARPTAPPLAPATATATPLNPYAALQTEIASGATLRGQIWGMDPEPQADGMELRIWDALTTPSLVDAQSDAYQIFKAVWASASYQIPSNWQIHLVFVVGATAAGPGTPIAVANLRYPTAHNFPWAQLSPAQAWSRYDGTLYDPSGISP